MHPDLNQLLPLLHCPACEQGGIQVRELPYPEPLPFETSASHLVCDHCGAAYPLTSDLIPILWTPALREQFIHPPDPTSNIGANIQIYDSISDDYQSYTRCLPANALRIQDGARRIQEGQSSAAPRYHLDFGCGPGQVLGWLGGRGLVQVGLDVSLANLRNARKATGALVVCGDATCMPFRDGLFSLVTEASVLHHIRNWQAAVRGACRICAPNGGVLLDAEPSREMVAFSRLAVWVFDLRFPVYKLLSYFWKSKYIFRDTEQAKLNLLAEIHHQPGTGFPLETLRELFAEAGFEPRIFFSPGTDLDTIAPPKLKNILLNLLSLRNPWDPKYGSFTAIGMRKG